jgi:hypothetical protein
VAASQTADNRELARNGIGVENMIERGVIFGDVPEKVIRAGNATVFSLQPCEVSMRSYARIDRLFTTLERCGKDAFQKILVSFAFDNDPRELYEIPEVQECLTYMYGRAPHMFYWFLPDRPPQHVLNQVYLMMLVEVRIERSGTNSRRVMPVSIPEFLNLRRKTKRMLLAYGEKIGDSDGTNTVIAQMRLNVET